MENYTYSRMGDRKGGGVFSLLCCYIFAFICNAFIIVVVIIIIIIIITIIILSLFNHLAERKSSKKDSLLLLRSVLEVHPKDGIVRLRFVAVTKIFLQKSCLHDHIVYICVPIFATTTVLVDVFSSVEQV